MRYGVFSLHDTTEIEETVREHGHSVDNKAPQIVITYGGDGTVLLAERDYPGIPKLTVQGGSANHIAVVSPHLLESCLQCIDRGDYRIQTEQKLAASTPQKTLYGMNEIHMHPYLPITAPRFTLTTSETSIEHIIADGCVISTSFGSEGYYYSVGGTPFSEGIGIALNNAHNVSVQPFVVDADTTIRIHILRGDPIVFADNNEKYVRLSHGETITIYYSSAVARLIDFPW